MTGTDLKFFTNEPERDLYSRFAAILKSNTQFFDVLVGYFRTSGFFKLYPALEDVEKIRILVGLNVDRFTVKIKNIDTLTDDQEEKIDILIRRWENGEIPARISKDVVKKSKVVQDILELYYEIMKLVPESYFEEKKTQQSKVDGEKQVILSCYIKRR